MPSTLYCMINKDGSGGTFVNYGPTPGNASLIDIDVSPAGVGVIGQGKISLMTADIIPTMSEVRIFMSDGVSVGQIFFGGFVANSEAGHIVQRATSATRKVVLQLVDYNILLDTMGVNYEEFVGFTNVDFPTQINRLVRHVTSGSPTGSETIFINNALTGNADDALGIADMTFRELLQNRMNSYQAENSATRPTFHMGAASSGSTAIKPQLEIYDLVALLAGAATYTFSDTAGGANIIPEAFRYVKDSSEQETYINGYSITGDEYVTAERRALLHGTYTNPYSAWGGGSLRTNAFRGKSVKLDDGLSFASAVAETERVLAARENPRGTIEITVASASITALPRPGIAVAVKWDTEALTTATKHIIAACNIKWRLQKQDKPVYTLQLGNRIAGLGEFNLGAFGRVVDRDRVRPNPPTGLSAIYIASPNPYEVIARISWTASTSGDTALYRVRGTVDGVNYDRLTSPDATPPTTMDFLIRTGTGGTLTVSALDHASPPNESLANPSVTFTASDTPALPADTLINPRFTFANPSDLTLPYLWDVVSVNAVAALSTTEVFTGIQTLKMTMTTGITGSSTATSSYVACQDPDTGTLSKLMQQMGQAVYKVVSTGAVTGKTISASILFYNKAGLFISEVFIRASGVISAAEYNTTQKDKRTVIPSNAVKCKLKLYASTDNSSAGTFEVYWGNCMLEPSIVSAQVGILNTSGVGGTPLTLADETGETRSMQQYSEGDTQTEYNLYDADGDVIGRLSSFDDGIFERVHLSGIGVAVNIDSDTSSVNIGPAEQMVVQAGEGSQFYGITGSPNPVVEIVGDDAETEPFFKIRTIDNDDYFQVLADGTVNIFTHKITNVLDPTAAQDAATKAFVDAAVTAAAVPDATTTVKGKVELATDGESAANVVVQGNDARMSNARTPSAHAASHHGGSDPVTPAGIGASAVGHAHAAADVTSGTLAIARGGTNAATASANRGFMGPTSGGAAAPSFRVLVSADIPVFAPKFTSITRVLDLTLSATYCLVISDTATAGADINLTFPLAGDHAGRVYYVVNTGTGFVTNFIATGSDVFGVTRAASANTLASPVMWMFISDGVDQWTVLVQDGPLTI